MVVEWFFTLIQWAVGIFPNWSPFETIDIETMILDWYDLPVIGLGLNALSYADHFIPISESLALLSLMVTFLLARMGWQLFHWIWNRLPWA